MRDVSEKLAATNSVSIASRDSASLEIDGNIELVSTLNTGSNSISTITNCLSSGRRLNFGTKPVFSSSESVLFGVFRVFWGVLQSHWKAVSSKKRIVAQKSRIVAQKTRIVAVKGRWPAGRRWLPILRSMRLRVAALIRD